jgi:hypothetical protein
MPLQAPPVRYDLIQLRGGLDQVTPTLSLRPGVVRRAANFEANITGGYSRIAGYERYDGRPNPSDAIYNILVCSLSAPISVGQTVQGQASGSTGKVIAVDGSNIVITREVDAFVAGEGIAVGGVSKGTITQVQGVSADGLSDATYKGLAADDYRADIEEVPGEGPILGVAFYNGVVYAWRNAVGGTEANMYESSSTGWQLVTTPTLAPDGRFETVIANFGGGTANYKLYGCDGKNKAFEFDGTTYTELTTGMSPDTPDHIAFHKQHLFLSFGASLQFSALGDPTTWSPILGAGELALNGPITNLLPLPGDQSSGALAVYTRNDTSVLYGTSSANFQLSQFNTGTGAIPYTAQNMDQAYVLDDRGVMSLGTSLNFGNFLPASLTMNLRPYIEIRRNLASGSSVNRDKGQYRVFFSDANALYMTFLNGKLIGSMPVQFLHPVTCIVEGESPDGAATSFFGSTNGFVYRLDAGTSFDGEAIPANLNLVYNAIGSPRILKRYRKASIEMTGDSFAEIQFGYDLGYRTPYLDQPADASYANDLRSAYWDSMTWDNFVWDGSDISPSEIEVSGTAENMAIRISCVSAILQPFTVNSIIVHYTPRRGLR